MLAQVRAVLQGIDRVSPTLAGTLALQLFCYPLPNRRLAPDRQTLVSRAGDVLARGQRADYRIDHRHTLRVYRFDGLPIDGESPGTAVLVHGWTGAAFNLAAFVEPLRARGFDVVCFDLPAHGDSSGRMTDARRCAQAVRRVIRAHGPVSALIGHSFGGAAISFALREGDLFPPQLAPHLRDLRVALIASPNQLSYVTAQFAGQLGLSAAAQRVYEARLSARNHISIADAAGNISYGRAGRPLLVVHCRDDKEIAFSQGENFTQLGDLVTFHPVSGLGHRRILYAPEVIERVVDFVDPKAD
ncbi:MAG: alpha/beta hydrolase family protein [Acidobacteriota bacterium]